MIWYRYLDVYDSSLHYQDWLQDGSLNTGIVLFCLSPDSSEIFQEMFGMSRNFISYAGKSFKMS